jgi:hypothetical protein
MRVSLSFNKLIVSNSKSGLKFYLPLSIGFLRTSLLHLSSSPPLVTVLVSVECDLDGAIIKRCVSSRNANIKPVSSCLFPNYVDHQLSVVKFLV